MTNNCCPICLQSIDQESYLDSCFHKFCYHCITRWAKVDASRSSGCHTFVQCPLCKKDNLSIIHGFVGDSFQRHYVSKNFEKSFSLSCAHEYRLKCYCGEPGTMYEKFNILQYWKRQRYLQPNKWLQNWLEREIQAIVQEEDVDIIMHHILGVVESFLRRTKQEHLSCTPEQNRKEFKDLISNAARPFLFGRTERFVDELELFLVSGLNIDAYDELYMQILGLNTGDETDATGDVHDRTLPAPYLLFLDEDMDISD